MSDRFQDKSSWLREYTTDRRLKRGLIAGLYHVAAKRKHACRQPNLAARLEHVVQEHYPASAAQSLSMGLIQKILLHGLYSPIQFEEVCYVNCRASSHQKVCMVRLYCSKHFGSPAAVGLSDGWTNQMQEKGRNPV